MIFYDKTNTVTYFMVISLEKDIFDYSSIEMIPSIHDTYLLSQGY